jgi:hypothetical protein
LFVGKDPSVSISSPYPDRTHRKRRGAPPADSPKKEPWSSFRAYYRAGDRNDGCGIMLAHVHRLLRSGPGGEEPGAAGLAGHADPGRVIHRPALADFRTPRSRARTHRAWNSLPLTIGLELGTFCLGILLFYGRVTRARGRVGSWALWSMLGFLALIWGASLLGPPPPSVRAVALSGVAAWVFVPWGYWVDRHRETVPRA